MSTCTVPDCWKAASPGRRICSMHKARRLRTGSFQLRTGPSAIEKFHARVQMQAGGCWLWTGATVNTGYGRFTDRDRDWLAHRWAFEHLVAPIPQGMVIDHLCRVRLCVNPEHLESVTQAENVRRENLANGRGVARTHCPQGHPYSGGNLVIGVDGRSRLCRECHRASDRRRRERAA